MPGAYVGTGRVGRFTGGWRNGNKKLRGKGVL